MSDSSSTITRVISTPKSSSMSESSSTMKGTTSTQKPSMRVTTVSTAAPTMKSTTTMDITSIFNVDLTLDNSVNKSKTTTLKTSSSTMNIIESLTSAIDSANSTEISGLKQDFEDIAEMLIRFQTLSIIFGMIVLFLISVGIGCLCWIKCQKKGKKLRRLINFGRPQNRNPIYNGPMEMTTVAARQQQLQRQHQEQLRQEQRIAIGEPVLAFTSVVNENYVPIQHPIQHQDHNLYEKEK